MSDKSPISIACEAVGGLSCLARILNVKPPTVSQWISHSRPIPVERCAAIERATNGVVTRQQLRPNDWALIWPELAEKEPEHA